jgi:glycosyltransferase involved in cell wall biosynthesis
MNNPQRKKILFLTQFFYPDIQATSQLFYELSEDLAKDYDVNIVCGLPLMEVPELEGGSPEMKAPEGVRIDRVFSARLKRKSFSDRALNHISFLLSSFFFLLFNRREADLFIYTSDNPLNCLHVVLFLNKAKIYICQDLYLEQGWSLGMFKKGIVRRALSLCQGLSFRCANKVIVIGEKMLSYLRGNGMPKEKIELIVNWADTDRIVPVEKENFFSKERSLNGKFVVMHSGRIGLAQDMELLVECAESLREYKDIKFLIIGEGVRKDLLIDMAKEKNLENITFLPFQPFKTLKFSLGAASVGLALSRGGLAHSLVPSRLFSTMASGRPVIASAEENSIVEKIIYDSGCGIAVRPGDLDGLKEAILKIYNKRDLVTEMGKKGREYAVNHFSRSKAVEKYKKIIKELLAAR